MTDASRPRIRYVAGYCVAALRKRYTQIKQSKMFSHSKQAQSAFREAKFSMDIINLLKEEERYMKEPTTDRELPDLGAKYFLKSYYPKTIKTSENA